MEDSSVNQFLTLPKDVLAVVFTHMSFGEVSAICRVNKDMLSFCNADTITDRRIWRQLILDTYGGVDNLKETLKRKMNCSIEILNPNSCWNYNTYTNFIKHLTKITQGRIYIRMNDMEEFNKLDLINRNYAATLEERWDLTEFPEFEDSDDIDPIIDYQLQHDEISTMISMPNGRKFIEGRVLPDLVFYPEILKIVLNESENINAKDINDAKDVAFRLMSNDGSFNEVSRSIKLLNKYL